jgi:hypothetical protein
MGMEKLNQALEKIKSGEQEAGKRLLVEIIRANPNDELAWLYLATVIDDPEKKRECIERVLKINPNNQQALGMLNVEQDDEYRSFGQLTQVWMKFFGMTESFLKVEAKQSNNSDTFLCVAIYTIITVIFSTFSMYIQFNNIPPEIFDELSTVGIDIFSNIGMIVVGFMVCSIIFSPIAFYFGVGIQYIGARIFGGIGEYKTQAYLQAIILVPITIIGGLGSLISLVPFIGFVFGIIGIIVSIYGFILNVRAIKVAHDLTTGKAVGSLIIPPIALMVIIFCVSLGLGALSG